MKYLFILLISFSVAFSANAQAGKRTKTTKRTTAQQRGSGQYHGSRDTTPGSPMGTGGAGGNDMSGSPAGSAIETKDQTEAAKVNKGKHNQGKQKGTTHRKKTIIRKRI